MKFWLLPIESQSMRYSDQWLRWFKAELEVQGIEYREVRGHEDNRQEVKEGEVFDACYTNIYKLTQLTKLIEYIRNGEVKDDDIIFDFDIWHAGIEAVAYVKALKKLKTKMYGILHAGTYDKSDFTFKAGMRYFGLDYERCLLNIFDKVFVGSEYHKNIVCENLGVSAMKIIVTGMPINLFELSKYKSESRQNIVVWTSRIATEKRYDMYVRIKNVVSSKMKGVQFVATHEEQYTKEEYYRLLGKAKVVLSTAEHEMFGIGVVEGMVLGCIPVVPNGLSYVDYVSDSQRYNTEEEAVQKVIHALTRSRMLDFSLDVCKYGNSIGRMLTEMMCSK